MKYKKIFIKFLLVILLISTCSGCFKRDEMEDITIITTVYPLEYVLTKLYGKSSVINSIYPDGINVSEYKMTDKEFRDFSKKDLFVYNGLSSDKDLALKFRNKNDEILIMDANYGMDQDYGGIEELWLNPSNLLMISQNIKNGLSELIDSKYIREEITDAYNKLKVELSELDAEIKLAYENANTKTIVIASPSLRFLSKYGFDVILVDDSEEGSKNVSSVISQIKSKKISKVFVLDNDNETNALKKIKNETSTKIVKLKKIDNMTDEERDNKENYVTLMQKNIETLRSELE